MLFTSYAGEQFKLGDRELLLMREEDVLAVIEVSKPTSVLKEKMSHGQNDCF